MNKNTAPREAFLKEGELGDACVPEPKGAEKFFSSFSLARHCLQLCKSLPGQGEGEGPWAGSVPPCHVPAARRALVS